MSRKLHPIWEESHPAIKKSCVEKEDLKRLIKEATRVYFTGKHTEKVFPAGNKKSVISCLHSLNWYTVKTHSGDLMTGKKMRILFIHI